MTPEYHALIIAYLMNRTFRAGVKVDLANIRTYLPPLRGIEWNIYNWRKMIGWNEIHPEYERILSSYSPTRSEIRRVYKDFPAYAAIRIAHSQ